MERRENEGREKIQRKETIMKERKNYEEGSKILKNPKQYEGEKICQDRKSTSAEMWDDKTMRLKPARQVKEMGKEEEKRRRKKMEETKKNKKWRKEQMGKKKR